MDEECPARETAFGAFLLVLTRNAGEVLSRTGAGESVSFRIPPLLPSEIARSKIQ